MTTRLLPIDTCGDCTHFKRTWEGASIVFFCSELDRTICAWPPPRPYPPIPEDCPLPETVDYRQREGERYG